MSPLQSVFGIVALATVPPAAVVHGAGAVPFRCTENAAFDGRPSRALSAPEHVCSEECALATTCQAYVFNAGMKYCELWSDVKEATRWEGMLLCTKGEDAPSPAMSASTASPTCTDLLLLQRGTACNPTLCTSAYWMSQCRKTCGLCQAPAATTATASTTFDLDSDGLSARAASPDNEQSTATGSSARYQMQNGGACENGLDYIKTLAECSAAAAELGLQDMTAEVSHSRKKRPHGCYYKLGNAIKHGVDRMLWFNPAGDKNAGDDRQRFSICVTGQCPCPRKSTLTSTLLIVDS